VRLGSVRDGRVCAIDHGRVFVEPEPEAGLERRGRLPDPPSLAETVRTRLFRGPRLKRLLAAVVGAFPAENLWQVTDEDLVATAGPHLYSSHDAGETWTHRRRLPPSSGPMGVLPSAVCAAEGTAYLGEYPLDDTTPRVLRSEDEGRNWHPHVALPSVRHVHGVQRDPYTGDRWVTTGDRGDECCIGRLVDGEFRPVGRGGQEWRAVELSFTPSAVLWGVDSPSVAANRIYRLERAAFDAPDPEPTPVFETDGSVYYSAAWDGETARWVAFSTAVETAPDRTASDGDVGADDVGAATATVVAASSASSFTRWQTVAQYRKHRRPTDLLPGTTLPSANAYVFLAGDETRGLVYNPYNTRREAGTIRTAAEEAPTRPPRWAADVPR
jgi:hypothetical protein